MLCSQDCLRSERSCYLCSCEFIRIHEKEPLVPPTSCSTVSDVLCALVPVCGSAIVRTAGWSSCSFGQPSPTYGSHPTLAGKKLVIHAACIKLPSPIRSYDVKIGPPSCVNPSTGLCLSSWYKSFRLHGRICYHIHLVIIPLDW